MEKRPDPLEDELSSFSLHDAVELNDTEVLQKYLCFQEIKSTSFTTLVALKQLINSTDSSGCTPLHIAILNGHVRAVEILLAAGSQVSKACGGCPPVHLAVCVGQAHSEERRKASAAVLAAILAQGGDPQERDDYGRTALHWAVSSLAEVEVLRQLLEAAEASQAARLGALAHDVASGLVLPPEFLQHIIAAQDNDGLSSIHLACKFLNAPALRFLLQWAAARREAADAEAKTKAGETSVVATMTTAAAATETSAVASVPTAAPPPDRVALIKATNKEGLSALHIAADKGGATLVAALIEHLLQPAAPLSALRNLLAARDKKGRTAATLAARKGHEALARALEDLAAVVDAEAGALEEKPQDDASSDLAVPSSSVNPDLESIRRALASIEDLGKQSSAVQLSTEPSTGLARTAIIAPPECVTLHRTAAEPYSRAGPDLPPENPNRLKVLTTPESGILWSREFVPPQAPSPSPDAVTDAAQPPLARGVLWQTSAPDAALSDILKVHEWSYLLSLQRTCGEIPDEKGAAGIRGLDQDTALCRDSLRAAVKAAGAVCAAVDRLLLPQALQRHPAAPSSSFSASPSSAPSSSPVTPPPPVSNVFCAVRPPGHHAGPTGAVASAADPAGSSTGFCLLNNAAIGAAYALDVYRHHGIRRVAIVDFDVHHGNGTQACVLNTTPGVHTVAMDTPFCRGRQEFPTFKPWLAPGGSEEADRAKIFFASVQGFGRKSAVNPAGGWFYPGSGATGDSLRAEDGTSVTSATNAEGDAKEDEQSSRSPAAEPSATPGDAASVVGAAAAAAAAAGSEETENEWEGDIQNSVEIKGGPRIINVGVPGPGGKPRYWRRAWRDKVLPALYAFAPDLLFVSAGFDAHRKEEMNHRFVGVTETDYEWLTQQLVEVANATCQGRIVSVLEGGYNLSGGAAASSFARSVAAHVRVLSEPNAAKYDPADIEQERELERNADRQAKLRRQQKAAVKQQAAADKAAAVAAALAEGKADGDVSADIPRESKRRRRAATNVDYAALNAQLDAEVAAATSTAQKHAQP